ncbi:MAG: cold shock domain-containing protein [Paracoccaceae bacterium]
MIKRQVKWFDAAKGFGFVVSDNAEGDILLHANVLRNFGRSSVAEESPIVIDVQVTDRGRQASVIHEIGAPLMAGIDVDTEDAPSIPEIAEDIPFLPARVKWFDKAKGFGFANVFGNDADIFLHVEILRHYGLSDLQPGEAISIRIIDGPRGKMAGEVQSWDHVIHKDE